LKAYITLKILAETPLSSPCTPTAPVLLPLLPLIRQATRSAARGALIYNDSASGDPTVVVLDFGADKTSSSGDFTIVFPTADASNAIIRIA